MDAEKTKQMSITDKQKAILDSLVCERLSSNLENENKIKDFKVLTCNGKSLNANIQSNITSGIVWNENVKGKKSSFVIKSPDGHILAIFSLKYGFMYKPVELCDESNRHALEEEIVKDKERDNNQFIIHVSETIPAIEFTDFCVADCAKDFWEAHEMPQKCGKTLFWSKVIPCVELMSKSNGAEYLYIFVANDDQGKSKGKLESYYKEQLFFDKEEKLGVIKQ